MRCRDRLLEIGYLYNLFQSTVGSTNARPYFVNHFAKLAEDRFGSDTYSFFKADCSNARDWLAERSCRFDAILAAGVLHHLDDSEVRDLLDLAVTYCDSAGFFASFDNARIAHENPVAAALIRVDR